MKYEVILLDHAREALERRIIRDDFVDIQKLIADLQSIESGILTDVSPNRIEDVVFEIKRYLSSGGDAFVKNRADISRAIRVSRPTLNEWDKAGVIQMFRGIRRYASTEKEHARSNKCKIGYDIEILLAQLDAFLEDKRRRLYKKHRDSLDIE